MTEITQHNNIKKLNNIVVSCGVCNGETKIPLEYIKRVTVCGVCGKEFPEYMKEYFSKYKDNHSFYINGDEQNKLDKKFDIYFDYDKENSQG